jgi:hypothetical protein
MESRPIEVNSREAAEFPVFLLGVQFADKVLTRCSQPSILTQGVH